jgi:hypothetical protein
MTEESDKICRFCYEGNGELISPCKCSGSQKYLHRDCLEKWRNIAGANNKEQCSICRFYYLFEEDSLKRNEYNYNWWKNIALFISTIIITIIIVIIISYLLIKILCGMSIKIRGVIFQLSFFSALIVVICFYSFIGIGILSCYEKYNRVIMLSILILPLSIFTGLFGLYHHFISYCKNKFNLNENKDDLLKVKDMSNILLSENIN